MWLKIDGNKAISLIGFCYKKAWWGWQQIVEEGLVSADLVTKLNQEGFFLVDEDIMHFIAYLNTKGFNTIASCSGHFHRNIIDCYVMFDNIYKLDSLFDYLAKHHNGRSDEMNLDGKLRYGFHFKSHEDRLRFLGELETYCKSETNMKYMYYPLDLSYLEMHEDVRHQTYR